jgi:hypothetical protein
MHGPSTAAAKLGGGIYGTAERKGYLGFGSVSATIHVVARFPSVTRAVVMVIAVVVLCR